MPRASWQQGLAERALCSVKSILAKRRHGDGFTIWQLCTLLTKAEQIIKSRPIGTSQATEVDANSRIITPLHLVGASALYSKVPVLDYVQR